MAKLIAQGPDILAGLERGGSPVVAVLGEVADLPCVILRQQAKEYGACKYAEGSDLWARILC
jgi:orotate phosphoribosyltransferase